MDEYVKSNRQLWDTWTPYHVNSTFYDVEGFKAGAVRNRRFGLDQLETTLVGAVAGKSLLHLQCHFGMDTIAWARRGAAVTGVDFSEPAIAAARRLAAELGIPARFVCCNVYDVRNHVTEQFDVVFTSLGVLGWLPDLQRWGQVIAASLKPGATFHIIEAHPFALIFDDRRSDSELRLLYPYFHGPEPIREEHPGSYAAPAAPIHSVEHIWLHTMSDIVESLARSGLRITSLREYPFVGWAMFPWLEQRADGSWQFPGGQGTLPLMFSLTACKDAA